jgi:hypothetical protein
MDNNVEKLGKNINNFIKKHEGDVKQVVRKGAPVIISGALLLGGLGCDSVKTVIPKVSLPAVSGLLGERELNDEFSGGDWKANWVIDSAAGKLIPTAYTEDGKSDLLLFSIPKGSGPGEEGTCKIMTKGGDNLGYGTYEARFKLKNLDFQNKDTGIYVGMGLWNFSGATQQEVMMGFYYEPKAHDYIQLLTTKDRPRNMKDDPNHKYHHKAQYGSISLKDFNNQFHAIKFDYQPDKVLGYVDDKLIFTKNLLVPDASDPQKKMALVFGNRVTGGTLKSDMDVVLDYIKITPRTSEEIFTKK